MVKQHSIEHDARIDTLDRLALFARERGICGLIVHVDTILPLPVMNVRSGEMLRRIADASEQVAYVTDQSPGELGRRLGAAPRFYASELGGLAAAVCKATKFLDLPQGEIAFVGDETTNEVLDVHLRPPSGLVGKQLLRAYVTADMNIFMASEHVPKREDFALAGPAIEQTP